MSTNLMPFIDLDDMQQGLPPFYFQDMGIRTFLLPADIRKLWNWCNLVLNVSPDNRFVPIAPTVILGLNTYPRMVTLNPAWKDKVGYTRQNEYYLIFPVLHLKRSWGMWLPHEITWAYPYIGVDCPTSAFTGREVLGFSKTIGTITYADDTQGRFRGTVTMPGFPALGPNVPEQALKLAEVQTGAPIINPPSPAKAFPWSLLQAVVDQNLLSGFASQFVALSDLVENLVMELFEDVDPSFFSVINLKQFRHPAMPQLAAYQSLDTCRYRHIGVSPVRIYDGGQVTMWDNPTTSPVAILGLGGDPQFAAAAQTTAGAKLTPLYVAGCETDMWFGEARTIWSCP